MLVMDPAGGDLVLVGTSPTSYRGATPSPAPSRPLGQTYSKQQDTGRLSNFFEQNSKSRPIKPPRSESSTQRSSRSTAENRPNKKHAPSYVDDTLFGPKPVNPDWPAPWEQKLKSKTYKFGDEPSSYSPEKYTSQPRPQSKLGSQTDRHFSKTKTRPQSRASTARSSQHSVSESGKSLKRPSMLMKHTPSYVDDMLFGDKLAEPEFEAPWQDSRKRQPKAFNFDYTNYKKGNGSQNTRPTSATKIHHSRSYVDETLFGPKLADPGWAAPWNDGKDSAKAMNIYDAHQHRVTIEHDDVEVVRPKSLVAMQRRKPPTTAKPAWR